MMLIVGIFTGVILFGLSLYFVSFMAGKFFNTYSDKLSNLYLVLSYAGGMVFIFLSIFIGFVVANIKL